MKFIILVLIFGSISFNAFAQQNSLKLDLKYEITKNDFITVNDTTNHVLGFAEGSGSVIFNDGKQGTVSVYFVYDYLFGNGDFTEYYDIIRNDDGSKLTLQAKGKSVGSSNGYAPLFTGSVIITGGNGVYEGLYGEGSCTGNRNESLTDGAKVKMSFTISTHN